MIEKEKKLKEIRLLEATKKGLLGFSGKYGTILRFFGQPIIDCIDNSSGGFIENEFYGRIEKELPNYFEEDESIPTIEIYNEFGDPIDSPNSMEWTESSNRKNYYFNKIGFYYQNMKNPQFNLEIKFLDSEKELIVTSNGKVMFREVSGDLVSYVPDEEFEKFIFNIYDKAKKLENEYIIKENKLKTIKAEQAKISWLETMKKLWGFK